MPSNRELKRQIDELREQIDRLESYLHAYNKSFEISFRDIYREIGKNTRLIELLGEAVQKILDKEK